MNLSAFSFSPSIVINVLIALTIASAAAKILLHLRRHLDSIDDAHARIDAVCAEIKKYLPEANFEFDPASTQEVERQTLRERFGKKKWWIVLGVICALLVTGSFMTNYSDSPKSVGHSGKHAKVQAADVDDKTEAPPPKADSCGKCKPEMPGGIIDTDPNVGYIFADKCVGDGDCAACKPVGCVGENAAAPPSCKTCSSSGK